MQTLSRGGRRDHENVIEIESGRRLASGCLELTIVTAVFVSAITFVIACVLNLHTGTTLPLSALKALSAVATALVGTTVFLPTIFAVLTFLNNKFTIRKL